MHRIREDIETYQSKTADLKSRLARPFFLFEIFAKRLFILQGAYVSSKKKKKVAHLFCFLFYLDF